MTQVKNQSVIDMLRQVLGEAERGDISSAVVLTMNGAGGHVGYWSRITDGGDAAALPHHLEELRTQLAGG